ncbi:DNA repair protein RadC [Marinobacter nauticus]|uniref:DNA repair protein RadC n=1 Tax=Marinobacter nauticus TaxID=2743 RepID=A0A368XBD3_MARNT|nr:DNA repair protein RadC [Marinobacter nauticus]
MKKKSQDLEYQVPLDLGIVEEPAQVYRLPEKANPKILSVEQQLEAIAQTPEGIKAIFRKSCELIDKQFEKIPEDILNSPAKVKEVLKARLAHVPHEEFGILVLNTRHQAIAFEVVARGTIDGAKVYPREVVKAILKHNGAACIAVHNHPSGVCEPSQADIQLTSTLKMALATVDIRFLDHMIVGRGEPYSLAEHGKM